MVDKHEERARAIARAILNRMPDKHSALPITEAKLHPEQWKYLEEAITTALQDFGR